MEFETYQKLCLKFWDEYLKNIYNLTSNRRLTLGEGHLLYPNIALFTETKNHYIFELLGASRSYEGLTSLKTKEKSSYRYFSQFGEKICNPLFNLGGRNNLVSTFILSRETDYKHIIKKFNIPELWFTHLSFPEEKGEGSVFSFKDSLESFNIKNCLLLNRYNEIYRIKHILYLNIISKTHTKRNCVEDFHILTKQSLNTTNNLFGIHFVPEDQIDKYVLSSQFLNFYLSPKQRETSIGKFLFNHPQILKKTLDCTDFLYETNLEWIEKIDSGEKYIRPDFMIKKDKGLYDICELKTPLTEKKNITKGKHMRRRFIDDVMEGVAQLSNYEEYFKYEKNIEYVYKNFGIRVEEPLLYLIVGNYSNTDEEEIMEAKRMLKSNYVIMDYDTLRSMYVLK